MLSISRVSNLSGALVGLSTYFILINLANNEILLLAALIPFDCLLTNTAKSHSKPSAIQRFLSHFYKSCLTPIRKY